MYFKYIVIAIVLFVTSKADQDETLQRVKRNGNSHKASVDKGKSGSDGSRGIKEMIEKVDRMDAKLDKLEAHMMKTSEVLSYWTETAGLEDHNYWKETTGCGGVIQAASGRILSGTTDSTLYSYVECMWTIMAGHRSKVKLTLRRQISSPPTITEYWSNCEVLEVKLNYGNSSETPVYARTSITEDKTYLFRGPLLYLNCLCYVSPSSAKAMFLEYEGMGPNVYSRVDFHHVQSKNATGFFDVVTELNNGASQLKDKEVAFITIALPGQRHDSNAPVKNILVQSLSSEFCKTSSMTMQFDAARYNTTTMVDCCKVDCLKHKFLVSYGYCIITISANISTVFEGTTSSSSASSDYAKLAWDIQEHSKYNPNLELECGGVISGRTSGKISQTYSRYRANSRCIWIIHPFPRTDITVTVNQLTIEAEHDKLYAIGLDDDGEIIATTRFTDDVDTYNLTGRVILIVFYTDTSLQMTGFSLFWRVTDYQSPTDVDMFKNDDQIHRYIEKNGTANWNITMPPSWPGLNVGVINHYAEFRPYSYDINLGYAVEGSAKFHLFGSTNGTFDILINATETGGSANQPFGTFNFTSQDGIFLVIGKVYKPQSSLSLDFQWNQGKAVAPTSYSDCGGIIEPAQHARIDFKTGRSIGVNTRCVWLIDCRYSTVTFNLIKNGLTKYGQISIDAIDTATGKVANGTKRIDSTTGNVVVSGPLIMVTFASHVVALSDTGFELEYKGSGESIDDDKTYEMRHLTARSSTFEYPVESILPTSNDIYVFAQNADGLSSSTGSEKLSLQFLSHAMQNNTLGQGYKFSLYSYPSWNSNTTFEPAVECIIFQGELENECTFLKNFTYSDFHSKSETFEMKFNRTGFLFIVKPLEQTEGMESREFELTWNLGGCGGLLGSLPNGKIEYKLSEIYSTGEDCIWIVDGSKFGATSIVFTLEASGVLDRDYLYVYPIQAGVINSGKRMRYDTSYSSYITASRSVTAPSGVAIVIFRSTSLYYSQTGRGFRLAYSLRRLRTKAPASLAGKTFVMYPNPMVKSMIELPFKKKMTSLNHNDTVIMFFNTPPATTSSTSPRINITMQDLNLFVNNKTCTSDTLYFYYYSYASFNLKDSYRSYKNPEITCNETTTMTLVNEEELPADAYEEEIIYEDTTSAPVIRTRTVKNTCNPTCYETNVTKTLTPLTRQFQITAPFIAIYKSNSNDGEGKQIKFAWSPPSTLDDD